MLRSLLPDSWFVLWYHPQLGMYRWKLKFTGRPNGSYYWCKVRRNAD